MNKEIGRDGNDTFERTMIVQQFGSSNVERVHVYDIAEEECVQVPLYSTLLYSIALNILVLY